MRPPASHNARRLRTAAAIAGVLAASPAGADQPPVAFRAAQADAEVLDPIDPKRTAEGMTGFLDRHRRTMQLIARSPTVHAIANYAPSWRRDGLYRPVDVEIRPAPPGRDFVLVLVSHEPTQWRLALAPGARWPEQIVVAGAYAPRLAGPPRGTPVTALDRTAFRRESTCRPLTREFDACWRRPYDALDSALAQLTGAQLDSFQGSQEAKRAAAPPDRRAWLGEEDKAATRRAAAWPAAMPTEPPPVERRERPLDLGGSARARAVPIAVAGTGSSACPGGRYVAARDLCASDNGRVVELPLWSSWVSARMCTERFVFGRLRPEKDGTLAAEFASLGVAGLASAGCATTTEPLGRVALWTADAIPFRAPVKAIERVTIDYQSTGSSCVAAAGTTERLREPLALCVLRQQPLVAMRIDGPVRLRTRAGTWEPLCAPGLARRGGTCEPGSVP